MTPFKIRVLLIVLMVAALSFDIYSSYYAAPLLIHYLMWPKETKGQNITRFAVNHSTSMQDNDSATDLLLASLVSYDFVSSASLSSSTLMPTITVQSSNSATQNDSDEGVKPSIDSKAGQIPKADTTKKSISSLQTMASTEYTITSSVYTAGHDIPAADLCQHAGSGMQLLILVISAPNHTDARMAIRQTWGSYAARRDVSVGFFVAYSADQEMQRSLESESSLYGDIIRANVLDSYVNLTLKSISMQEWVDRYCPKVRFILKTDDDVFINVPRLLNFTEKHLEEKRTIYGKLANKWKPVRNIRSKYFVSVNQFKHKFYPNFTTGPAYLLTNDTVHDLYVNSLNKTYLHLEDVFITGIVAQDIKITRIHSPEFFNVRIPFNACKIRKGISIHKVKFPELFDIWKKLSDGTTIACKK